MALYFFDIDDDGLMSRDEFGLDLESVGEARRQATVLLADIAGDELSDGEPHVFECHVRDRRDRVVYKGTLTFRGERLVSDP